MISLSYQITFYKVPHFSGYKHLLSHNPCIKKRAWREFDCRPQVLRQVKPSFSMNQQKKGNLLIQITLLQNQ